MNDSPPSTAARILAVSHNLNLEGAPIYLLDIVEGIERQGVGRAELLSLADGPAAPRLGTAGRVIHDAPFPRLWLRSPERIGEAIDRLASFIERERFDLIWANTFVSYPAVHAAARAGIPVVWQIHESQPDAFWNDYLGSRFALALEAMPRADAVVFMAEATRALWRERIGGERCWHTLPYGLNRERFAARSSGAGRAAWRAAHGIDPEATLCLNIGTLHERKGQRDLLEAVAALPGGSRVSAVCVGDRGGDYSDALHAWISGLPAERRDRIHLLPMTSEVEQAYGAADLFVCCSRNESYPLVILEALAAGLPVISTPVFGIAEQLRFGTDGLAYAPGDTAALGAHITRLHADPAERRRWAQAVHRRHEDLPHNQTHDRAYAALARALALRRTEEEWG